MTRAEVEGPRTEPQSLPCGYSMTEYWLSCFVINLALDHYYQSAVTDDRMGKCKPGEPEADIHFNHEYYLFAEF